MRFQGRYIRDCKRRAAGQKLHQERANIRQNSDRWNWATHGKRPYSFFTSVILEAPLPTTLIPFIARSALFNSYHLSAIRLLDLLALLLVSKPFPAASSVSFQ